MLQHADQLRIEMLLGNVPRFLKEGQIGFAPTYKRNAFENSSFDRKQNPSWTDRVLYHCDCGVEPCRRLKLKAYDANNNASISDHRPVFAQFVLRLSSPVDVVDEDVRNQPIGLAPQSCLANALNTSKELNRSYIEEHNLSQLEGKELQATIQGMKEKG